MCPVKMMLIVALRIGALDATTIDDAMNSARARRDKAFAWSETDQEWPVLPAFARRGLHVLPDTPVGARQLSDTLQIASDIAGLLKVAKSHDVRRGAVRDLVNTKGISSTNIELAAEALNHASKAKAKGVTKAYVGSRIDDTWSKRVEQYADNEPDIFDLQFAGEGLKKRRLTTAQTDACCEEHQIDASDRRARLQAADKIKA